VDDAIVHYFYLVNFLFRPRAIGQAESYRCNAMVIALLRVVFRRFVAFVQLHRLSVTLSIIWLSNEFKSRLILSSFDQPTADRPTRVPSYIMTRDPAHCRTH